MRKASRSIALAVLTLGAVLLLAFVPTTSVLVALTATALYMGGTSHSLSVPQDTPGYIADYIGNAYSKFVAPSGLCTGACAQIAVYTPEQFRFDTGLFDMTFDESVAIGLDNLDACVRGLPCTVTKPPFTTTGTDVLSDTSYVIFAYSQSATTASFEKYDLIAHPPPGTNVSFILVSNPNRPNGGFLERFVGAYLPIVGVTFSGATTTNSPQPNPVTTVDAALQYDTFADFPTNPLNLLADLNALLGFPYRHAETDYFAADNYVLQGQFQDTTYYLGPAETLPLLMPLKSIPFIGPPLAAALDPPLRVLVEAGYDRTINPGQPTPAKWLYVPNLIKTAVDFVVAVPTGWDNAIAQITENPANRPFCTTVPGPYGVGGPPVYTGAVDPYGPPTPLTIPLAKATPARTGTAVDPRRRPAARATPTPSAERPSRRAHGTATGSLRTAAKPADSSAARAATARPSAARPAA